MTPAAPPFARKSLGQHFLFDRGLLQRIASLTGPLVDRCVVEVGPGPGGLTRALLDAGAARVVAIEADERFFLELGGWPEAAEGRLHVHHRDAREVDETAMLASAGCTGPARLIANLPYNVATPLLAGWLTSDPWWEAMALMFQKEVADRITARPGEEAYGRLSVLTQATARAAVAMTLPPGAFRPPPKVQSSVVLFSPLGAAERFDDVDALSRVSAAAFGQRRKMLRTSLRSLGEPVDVLGRDAGVDLTRRAETLDQSEFRALASAWRRLASARTS